MSLPLPAIDRLFVRLQATYGRDFIARYDGIDIAAVKTSWGHELDGYRNNLLPLAWALENLPERCPNVIEFRALCRRAPAAAVLALPEPAADAARVAAELAKLKPMCNTITRTGGNKDWAHRLLNRHQAGEKINATPLRMARSAVGMEVAA